jgi:putative endonuclease
MRSGYTYILASKRNGTLYTGVPSDIFNRVSLHRTQQGSSFTSKYGVRRLVYFEYHDTIQDAIAREKQLKKWKRDWKIALIESVNPGWIDLYEHYGRNPELI